MPLTPMRVWEAIGQANGRCARMIPAEFDYAAPDTLEDAIAALKEGGEDAKLLAGGHSLLPLMKLRLATPSLLDRPAQGAGPRWRGAARTAAGGSGR